MRVCVKLRRIAQPYVLSVEASIPNTTGPFSIHVPTVPMSLQHLRHFRTLLSGIFHLSLSSRDSKHSQRHARMNHHANSDDHGGLTGRSTAQPRDLADA